MVVNTPWIASVAILSGMKTTRVILLMILFGQNYRLPPLSAMVLLVAPPALPTPTPTRPTPPPARPPPQMSMLRYRLQRWLATTPPLCRRCGMGPTVRTYLTSPVLPRLTSAGKSARNGPRLVVSNLCRKVLTWPRTRPRLSADARDGKLGMLGIVLLILLNVEPGLPSMLSQEKINALSSKFAPSIHDLYYPTNLAIANYYYRMNVRKQSSGLWQLGTVVQLEHNHDPLLEIVQAYKNRITDLTSDMKHFILSLTGIGIPAQDIMGAFRRKFSRAPLITTKDIENMKPPDGGGSRDSYELLRRLQEFEQQDSRWFVR